MRNLARESEASPNRSGGRTHLVDRDAMQRSDSADEQVFALQQPSLLISARYSRRVAVRRAPGRCTVGGEMFTVDGSIQLQPSGSLEGERARRRSGWRPHDEQRRAEQRSGAERDRDPPGRLAPALDAAAW